jgi:CubicO group peptidase (beta-lactamase class C family)
MISISTKRAGTSMRKFTAWTSATLVSAMLAACGGGGGGDDTGSVTPPPPPPPPPPTNAAPVANAGAAVTLELPTDNASFTGTATDDALPAGSSLSYTWEFVSGPAGPGNSPGAVLTTTNAAATSARFVGGPGDYVFNFKASDGALTGTSTLNVKVNPNPNAYPAATSAGVHGWVSTTPAAESMDETKLNEARDYSISAGGLTDNEAGYIIRHGKLVYSWGDTTTRFEMKSTTKSMGGLALLLALDEGKLALSDKVSAKLPIFGTDPLVDTSAVTTGGLADITTLQLATHTSGLSKSDQAATLKLLYTPGTTWSYSDQGLNSLADVLTQVYAQDLNSLLFSRVYTTLGISPTDLVWRTNQFRTPTLNVNGVDLARRELASGINANVNAMARVGLLMLRKGVWGNQSILSNAIVATAHQPPTEVASATIADETNFPGATSNYGVLWWTNTTGQMAGVPTDAYWAWGLHETLIVVIPSLDLVIARAGNHAWHPTSEEWTANYAVLQPFIAPIVSSVTP